LDADVVEAFPAQELVRISPRQVPRDWPRRWREAGGKLQEDGRMIALKTDGIWKRLSRFGNPYPPFDFRSGMGVEDIDRAEAEALGLLGPDDVLMPNVAEHEEMLAASMRGISPDLRKDLKQMLEETVKDPAGRDTPNKVEIVQDESGADVLRVVTPRSATVIQPGAWKALQDLLPGVQREDLRALASARGSSSVDVRLDEQGGVVLDVRDADRSAMRSISQDAFGRVVISNDSFYLRAADRGRQQSARTLERQVQAARRLGVSYLRTHAALAPAEGGVRRVNGAVVWPRFGYDGPLEPSLAAQAAADLGVEVTTVQELLKEPGGWDWWKVNAQPLDLIFNVAENSKSSTILHDYLRRKDDAAV
jgi:hypothetical protein